MSFLNACIRTGFLHKVCARESSSASLPSLTLGRVAMTLVVTPNVETPEAGCGKAFFRNLPRTEATTRYAAQFVQSELAGLPCADP